MPRFGAESRRHLIGVHPDLVKLAEAVVKEWDCKLTDGVRTVEEQRLNILRGVSKTMNSKHLPQRDGYSHAIDLIPFPVKSWEKLERGWQAVKRADPGLEVLEFYQFIGFVLGMATAMGIKISSGTDWDGDREFSDHTFVDGPHFQLK